ncbi:hypothetical protein Tco_0105921 [Tanacetum coccineum]
MIPLMVNKEVNTIAKATITNEFDAWMEDVGTDDDEVPDDKVHQNEQLKICHERFDEAKLQKAVMNVEINMPPEIQEKCISNKLIKCKTISKSKFLGMESYQQKVNLTALTITFLGIEKEELFTITSEPVVGMIYENSKGEKRVMIHKEIHKFCDARGFERIGKAFQRCKVWTIDTKYPVNADD